MAKKANAKLAEEMRKVWPGFKKRLSRRSLGITGTYFTICDIKPYTDIGFTMPGNKVYLSCENDLLDHFDTIEERLFFIEGVFYHELMHQLDTDFVSASRICKGLPPIEAKIFAQISNVIEDPSIEFNAPRYMGGEALDALHFAVRNTYRFSEPINEDAPAFTQYMQAVIQYGDGGFLKGSITSEARKLFVDTIPIIDKTIEEPSGKKRVELQKTVFEMTRPLWEKDAKAQEEFEKLLNDLFKQLGKNLSSSSGKRPPNGNASGNGGASDSSQSAMQKKRNITFRKVSKEEAEKLGASSCPGSIPPDGDLEILIVEDDDDNGNNPGSGMNIPVPSGSNRSEKKDQNQQGDHGSGNKSETGDEKDGEGSSSKSDKGEKGQEQSNEQGNASNPSDLQNGDPGSDANSGNNSNSDSDSDNTADKGDSSGGKPIEVPYGDINAGNDGDLNGTGSSNGMRITYDDPNGQIVSEDGEGCIDNDVDDCSITPEHSARLAEEAEECLVELETERSSDMAAMAESLDIPEVDKQYSGVKVCNQRIPVVSDPAVIEAYSGIVSMMKGQIKRMTIQIKRIIDNDVEEIMYKNSGKINIKRLSDANLKSSVFDKRVDPGNKANMAVCIAVDNSGSMGGNKIRLARECVIGITEAFAALNIPVKVIGFTTGSGYHAVHFHYVNWRNKHLRERATLLNIDAHNCNFDGFAIRYASSALKKRPEEHKLLIVISDGQPSSSFYNGRSGIADAKNAINEASKFAGVIGVGIDADFDVLHTIYGPNFLPVNNVSELFTRLAKRIEKEMKM